MSNENVPQPAPVENDEPPTPEEVRGREQADLERRVASLFAAGQSGANWFYWVAGLSIVNSIMQHLGGGVFFIMGLGVTSFVDAVAAHVPLADRKGVRLVTDVPGPDTGVTVDVDPIRIHQVLDNLLSNALRHTPAGGEVRVTLTGPTADAVEIAVVDTGSGFPPDAVDEVFERFTRAADSRGSGLGLSIARDLVVAHGGTIRAWNVTGDDGVPVGAGVAFTLPATPVP